MSEFITLAHISDLHLPPGGSLFTWRWNVKRMVGLINWYRNRRTLYLSSAAAALAADIVTAAPDHIAVTGDLANFGLPGEFETGLAWLATLGARERVSLIPGNHDIYTVHCDAACLAAWEPYMQCDTWGEAVAAEPGLFPYVRRVGNVAVVAVNSAVPTKLFLASGRVGERQMGALAQTLDAVREAGLVCVVLIHHPPLPGQAPQRRALVDARKLQDVLVAHGVDLVLHGHNHRDTVTWARDSNGARFPVVGVATGSVGRVHPHEPLARYNLYRIAGQPGAARIEMITRGLASTGGEVVELKRVMLEPGAQADLPAR
jgi:3',5'-cyclic AMP phosphodiesterase CpdA